MIGDQYFQVAGFDYRAAYYVWSLVWHRWPEMLLHSCDHPWCVNPEHLSEDTQSENEHYNTERTGVVMVTLSMTLILTITWIEECARHAPESVN